MISRKHSNTLKKIKQSIENESISYSEIFWLQNHQDIVKEYADIELAQWANIPEEEFV